MALLRRSLPADRRARSRADPDGWRAPHEPPLADVVHGRVAAFAGPCDDPLARQRACQRRDALWTEYARCCVGRPRFDMVAAAYARYGWQPGGWRHAELFL